MPAQPVSSLRRHIPIHFVSDALNNRPAFSGPIAKTILLAATGDNLWSSVLSRLLGAEAAAASAIHTAVRREAVQWQVITAAANVHLNDNDYRLFWAVRYTWGQAIKDRNIFAHWIAGYSDEIPNAILFGEPEMLASWSAAIHLAHFHGSTPQTGTTDLSKILMFYETNMKNSIRSLSEAHDRVARFGDFLWLRHLGHASADQTRDLLIQQSDIGQGLAVYDKRFKEQGSRPK